MQHFKQSCCKRPLHDHSILLIFLEIKQTFSIEHGLPQTKFIFLKKYLHILISLPLIWWLCMYFCKNLLIIPACDQLWLVAVIISQLDLIHCHSMDPGWWHTRFIMKQQIPCWLQSLELVSLFWNSLKGRGVWMWEAERCEMTSHGHWAGILQL